MDIFGVLSLPSFLSSSHCQKRVTAVTPTPLFLLSFSFRWFVLGILCFVPFVLISKVWQPLFTFLHIYFGPCSRDASIYFPALCACIMHDVCIYIPAPPFRCDYHSLCHLRQAMPNFRHESEVTCCWIFAMEIWYFIECLRKA